MSLFKEPPRFEDEALYLTQISWSSWKKLQEYGNFNLLGRVLLTSFWIIYVS